MISKVSELMALAAAVHTRRPTALTLLSQKGRQTLWQSAPAGPGCSRWMTCSCCRTASAKRTSRTSSIPHKTAENLAPSNLAKCRPPDDEQRPIAVPDSSSVSTPHLPFPSPLPYSPNSHPFRRHLSILSLSLLSPHADESWQVFAAMHHSLHEHIPDEVFKLLLIKQIAEMSEKTCWDRVQQLLDLGTRYDFRFEQLGRDVLENALNFGLKAINSNNAALDEAKGLRSLWDALAGMTSCLNDIPFELRKNWLELQISLLQARNDAESNTKKLTHSTPMEETLLDVVERGGSTQLHYHVGKILFLARGTSLTGMKQSLRLMTWCMNKGAKINVSRIVMVMIRMVYGWDLEKQNGYEKLEPEIANILKEAKDPTTPSTEAKLQEALKEARQLMARKGHTPSLMALARHENIKYPSLLRKIIKLSSSAKHASSQEKALQCTNTALQLFDRALGYSDETHYHIITSVASALYQIQKAHSSPDISQQIIHFIQRLYQARIATTLPSNILIPLFRLILAVLPSDDAYLLSRKLYEFTRAADPPFVWSYSNFNLWRSLFQCALNRKRRHLHFASRLYTDCMADGIPIRRDDALTMIQAIGSKPSSSRPILLERHIKDYLWYDYGQRPALVTALVKGLTNSVKDTELALNLAERLSINRELSPLVIQLIIAQLSKSSLPEHRQRCIALLHRLPTDAVKVVTWSYNTVLSYLVSSARPDPKDRELSKREMLDQVVALYKDMVARGIKPNGRTVGTILRALTDNGMVDTALAIFNACVDQHYTIKSHAIGRLMVRLALEGREVEAEEVESRWRAVNTPRSDEKRTSNVYDMGVVGARVLIDIKRGLEVDYKEVYRKTGWEGSKEFLQFLETLKPAGNVESVTIEREENIENDENLDKNSHS
nr:hypothetical protein L203_00098 [Cryptococcus depauperatus CBS 7841]